jgi:hypothetical protein
MPRFNPLGFSPLFVPRGAVVQFLSTFLNLIAYL